MSNTNETQSGAQPRPIRQRLADLKYSFLRGIHHGRSYPKSFDWDWKRTPENRITLVKQLVASKAECSYLEIGCFKDDLFREISAAKKVGVDPVRGGNVRKTSDAFFSANSDTFDVVFIDGLHTYDQVRRDVVNSMRVLRPGGWAAMHDMLPRNWAEEHSRVLSSQGWTGDVWKVGFELSRTRGVDFRILKIDNGVGVFRLAREKPELVDRIGELSGENFAFFYEHIGELPLVEWQDAQTWLRSPS